VEQYTGINIGLYSFLEFAVDILFSRIPWDQKLLKPVNFGVAFVGKGNTHSAMG
jgi:hypothetical protein